MIRVLPLRLFDGQTHRRVLALAAHPDDVEIGAGGLLQRLAESSTSLELTVVAMSGSQQRANETRACLTELVAPCVPNVEVHALRDTRLPQHADEVKDILGELARRTPWDLVLAPHRYDAHQDHRLLGEFVPTAFRNHLVLHYEIVKWDGDLGRIDANAYVALTEAQVQRKWQVLDRHHVSQREHDWWDEETFAALARLRGVECRSRYAEAYRIEKALLDL